MIAHTGVVTYKMRKNSVNHLISALAVMRIAGAHTENKRVSLIAAIFMTASGEAAGRSSVTES